MTESPDEYGEVLRRVLRAEADSVVPSAEGLQIIRTRIEQRDVRGIFWWRAAASAFGAVLVAATVVMVVPDLREQFTDQQIVPVQFDTSPPDESSTRRPWNGVQSPVGGSQRPGATPVTTPTPSPVAPKPTVTTSPGNDCATVAPTAVEPEAGESPQPCAEPTATDSGPEATTRPDSTPTPTRSPSPTPTPKITASSKPTVEPTVDPSPPPTDTAPPVATPMMTTESDNTAPQT
ncbi:hypothetical protein [Sphaerisporangium perillae]|uniref:hypothetical protein n=1 Tax=Sphaerisporangium perillae TaxID=2935860 RepID=UPI002435C1F4|nr:hypothetical protein [Sphaerisporangium perillae]